MKKVMLIVLALLVGAIIAIGVMEMGDNPDWTLPVSIRAQEISNLSVDIASQSLNELTIRITGQDIPVTIEPAAGVIFNITGDVNATVQGTASVSIDNATITVNVATLKEQASEAGKVATSWWSSTLISGNGGTDSGTLYTNNETTTVYVEMITHTFHALNGATNYSPAYQIWIKYTFRDSGGGLIATFYTNPYQVLNFDPAIPLPPGGYITVDVLNDGAVAGYYDGSVIIRKS